MNNSLNRASLVNWVEKLVHAHGYVSLDAVDLTEKAVSTIALSSRDETHDWVFRAACWALENMEPGDQLRRIYHYGDYTSLDTVSKNGPRIHQLGVEQFNGKTPRDDPALMILASKILSLGHLDCMFRIGNVDILAQMLAPHPYIVRHEVLRDLEELSKHDDRIQHLTGQHEGVPGNGTNISSVEKDIHDLCKSLVDKTEQEFDVKLPWKELSPVADLKQLFKEIRRLHVHEKWNATCGVSTAIGESLFDLLSLKWLPFDEALGRLLDQDFHKHTAALDLLKQTSEDLRALLPNGVPESRIALDPCFSHGLRYYTGIVFKIGVLQDSKHGPRWLCRGGRHDSLVADLARRLDGTADIPATGFTIDMGGLAEGATKMTPSGKGGPHFTRWIRSVNVITPATLRAEAEALADRLRGSPGLAVPVYESTAAVELHEHPTHELSVSLGDGWARGETFTVSQRGPEGEHSWRLDERQLTSFLDVDSRCRLGGGSEE